MNYIYRDFETTLGKAKAGVFLQALAISGGTITYSFVVTKAFPEKQVSRWSMFFGSSFFALSS